MQIIPSKLLNNYSSITQGFTTKKNGNFAFHVGDDKYNVLLNHVRLASNLNYTHKSLVYMQQIHSNIVKIVEEEDIFSTPSSCDALITDIRNKPLMVMVADCSPILFYDPIRSVIAVAHAGRAGTFSNIVTNVIQSFTEKFNSNTHDIVVSIGASIHSCCYEVGKEIYEEVKDLNIEYGIEKKSNNYYLDIQSIIQKQLVEAGILETNMEFSNECSCCNTEKYYSYRAENRTGRFTGIIFLN